MKKLGVFANDGFKASIEAWRFLRDMNNDIYSALVSIVGSNTVFLKGGTITQASGNTTITNGIILKDGNLYTFTGGTFAGTPADLKVLFSTATASGYPKPYFANDPISKDIYLANTASIDPTGTVVLPGITYIYNLQEIKQKIDPLRTEVDALKSKGSIQYPITGIGSGSNGYVNVAKFGNVLTISGYYLQGSTASTAGITLFSNNAVALMNGFPTDIRWLSCSAYSTIASGTNLAVSPTVKNIGMLIGGSTIVINLATTMAANTTVYFDATFINYL